MKHLIFVAVLTLIIDFLYSQNSQNWSVDFSKQNSFIENLGQFDGRTWQKDVKIRYAIDNFSNLDIFFSESGLTYRFDKLIKKTDNRSKSNEENRKVNITELINVEWINANNNIDLVAEDLSDNYFSYAIKDFDSDKVYNVNNIKGYKKLTYKNIYDKVDVVYELSGNGLKYKILLHPGADISKVKMKYVNRNSKLDNEFIENYLDKDGNFNIKASLGNIKELKPYSYYMDSNMEVKSSFKFENNILSFDLNYDSTKELIIDPWIVSPTLSSSTAVWEVETDSSGNVYIIGGETPMKLQKYNSFGALQWTYTTPWDTNSCWLGTLATDNTGISYITSGTFPEIEKINSSGGMVWHKSSPSSPFTLAEWWSITFNCNKTKIIVGGTGGNVPPMGTPKAVIYEMDIDSGNLIGQVEVNVGNTVGGYPIEIRSISSSNKASYIFLTHQHVGAVLDSIGNCSQLGPIFKIDNDNHLAYKCENFLPATQNGGGLKALVAGDQYFYTHTGDQIHKWLINDGTYVNSVNLTGGVSTVLPPNIGGGKVLENCGLAIDNCGNIYAGSGDRVVKFDANLNFISEALLPFSVYDVSVNSNGEIIAVGAQGNNQVMNRYGKIQSVNLNACNQFVRLCCDANICPVDTICYLDTLIDINSNLAGGIWSGNGIIDDQTGIFNPSIASPGSHYIYYTMPCGTDSILIHINVCSNLTACQESNGYISISGGAEPYTWEFYTEAISTPITDSITCVNCDSNYVWLLNSCYNFPTTVTTCNSPSYWSILGEGNTINPGINYPIRAEDIYGNSLIIYDISTLSECLSSIDEDTNNSIYKIIPNPSATDFTIEINSYLVNNVKLTLINSSGKEVYRTISNRNEIIIPGKNLLKGLYLLRIEIGNKVFTEKLSKK